MFDLNDVVQRIEILKRRVYDYLENTRINIIPHECGKIVSMIISIILIQSGPQVHYYPGHPKTWRCCWIWIQVSESVHVDDVSIPLVELLLGEFLAAEFCNFCGISCDESLGLGNVCSCGETFKVFAGHGTVLRAYIYHQVVEKLSELRSSILHLRN